MPRVSFADKMHAGTEFVASGESTVPLTPNKCSVAIIEKCIKVKLNEGIHDQISGEWQNGLILKVMRGNYTIGYLYSRLSQNGTLKINGSLSTCPITIS